MDALAKVIALTTIVSVVILGALVGMTLNDVNQANIPDIERGTVLSKEALSEGTASYSITLTDGKTLYILNDTALFNSINVNQTYVFTCRLDFNNQRTLVDQIEVADG